MNKDKFPGSIIHGEAYRRFMREMNLRMYSDDAQRDAWEWFLLGWQAKCKQREEWGR
jgi:hypothetical protein